MEAVRENSPHADDGEELDPRVQIELEKLNVATDEINCLEATLEDSNNVFRITLTESASEMQILSKRIGADCIKKARPYYEAVEMAATVQLNCQRAAVQYQRANAVHEAARQTIALAEERFLNGNERQFDSAWQEMLNHATIKVMEAEAQKAASEREHEKRASAFTDAENQVHQLSRRLKSSIGRSQSYFTKKAAVETSLESQKQRVQRLQREVSLAKMKYSQSLQHLEEISEEIHEQRRFRAERLPGVGAELPATENNSVKSNVSSTEDLTHHEQRYWDNLRDKLTQLDPTTNDYNSDCATTSNSNIDENKNENTESSTMTVERHVNQVVVLVPDESKLYNFPTNINQQNSSFSVSQFNPQGERPACEGQVESPVHSDEEVLNDKDAMVSVQQWNYLSIRNSDELSVEDVAINLTEDPSNHLFESNSTVKNVFDKRQNEDTILCSVNNEVDSTDIFLEITPSEVSPQLDNCSKSVDEKCSHGHLAEHLSSKDADVAIQKVDRCKEGTGASSTSVILSVGNLSAVAAAINYDVNH